MEIPRLDAYHFYEREWDDYDQLRESFEWEVPDQFNLAKYVCDRHADATPDRVAVYSENEDGDQRTYTFKEIATLTDTLAAYLDERGVERGDRVAINLPQKPETLLVHIASWKLGAVSVPLSTLFGADGLRYRLDDSDAVACVVDGSNVETLRRVHDDLPELESVLIVDADPVADETDLRSVLADPQSVDTAVTDAEETASILYTSGTTGEPKGVVYPHRILLGKLPFYLACFCNLELNDDVFWTPAEWAWLVVYGLIFSSLFYGKSVLAYEGGKFDPERTFKLIEAYDVTNSVIPPTALRMMMQVEDAAERYNVRSMRVLSTGGEAVGDSVKAWSTEVFGESAVHVAYGQTEMNGLIGDCTALVDSKPGTMGVAMPGHDVAIVDRETADPVDEPGIVGEIAARHEGDPVCFAGYLNRPERTRAKFAGDWLLTEDLADRDKDGYFVFQSRKDDLIISSGYRISPEEVEEHLATHEAVAHAGVIGVPHETRGEVPKAFISVADGIEPSDALIKELQAYVKDRLAKYEYPRKVAFLNELPKTATGKIRRHSLREREGLTD